jgi:integrase
MNNLLLIILDNVRRFRYIGCSVVAQSMRSTVNITKTVVEKMSFERKNNAADYRWDNQIKGFGVRVYPTGRKSFVVSYRNSGGQKRFHTLGNFGVLTVDQARRMAKERLAEVLNGNDPQADREAKRTASTVSDLCDRYLEQHAMAKKKPSSIQQDKRMIEKHVRPKLGKIKVADVSRSDVSKIHHSLLSTPYEGNRVLALISKMMNLAEKWGLRADMSNPCRHIERFKEAKRERFLCNDELSSLGTALELAEANGESPYAIAAIRLLALTGARLTEILTLKWEHVNFSRSIAFLPDSKTGAKQLFLSPPAITVLMSLDKNTCNPYVIVGGNSATHLKNLHGTWNRIKKSANLSGVRIHDLRHTFASFGASRGLSLPIIGKILGHTQAATTQRYAHLSADPVKNAVESIGNSISGAMRGTNDKKIIRFSSG